MENQYRRLTSERHNVSTPRFENMLMTTRRSPVVAGYGSAASLKVTSPIGSSAIKTSFFTRNFHSASARNSLEARMVLSRMAFTRRKTTTDAVSLPNVIAASLRSRLKTRAIARARAQQIDNDTLGGYGSLDIRLLRAKSPRNAEYLQRTAETVHRHETMTDVIAHRERSKKSVNEGVHSTSRQFIATSIVEQSADDQGTQATTLRSFRKEVEIRRSSTFLRVRKTVLKKGIVVKTTRRLFTRRKRARNRNFRH